MRAMIARTVPCATCAAAATSRCARPSRPARTTASSYSCSASRLRRAARSTRRRSSRPNSSRARPWPIRSASAIAANDSQRRSRGSLPHPPYAASPRRARHRHPSAPASGQPPRSRSAPALPKAPHRSLAHRYPTPLHPIVHLMVNRRPDEHAPRPRDRAQRLSTRPARDDPPRGSLRAARIQHTTIATSSSHPPLQPESSRQLASLRDSTEPTPRPDPGLSSIPKPRHPNRQSSAPSLRSVAPD